MKLLTLDIEEKFNERVQRAASGCLEWTGWKRKGYGHLKVSGRGVAAHRIACERAHGPAPEGKPHALHHCDNRACVEGAHLYWGNDVDNARDRSERGLAHGGRYKATHCVNGHPFDEENTYWEPRGWGRACKTCRRAAVRRMRAKRMAASAA